MKELNTIEVEQVVGAGLLSGLLGDVASTVGVALNTVGTVVTSTVPNILSSTVTDVGAALNDLGVPAAVSELV